MTAAVKATTKPASRAGMTHFLSAMGLAPFSGHASAQDGEYYTRSEWRWSFDARGGMAGHTIPSGTPGLVPSIWGLGKISNELIINDLTAAEGYGIFGSFAGL